MHSIVMQYVPKDQRGRIKAVVEEAGRRATSDRALAWVALEGNRTLLNHGLTVRYWPGGADWRLLASAHAHGAWVEWFDPPVADVADQVFF